MDGRSDRSHQASDPAAPGPGDADRASAAGPGGRSPRLSDADRSAAVERLAGHQAAGRLTADEVRERTTWVEAARTRADLIPVFADLPDDHPLRTASRDRHWRTHAALFALLTTAMLVVWLVVRNPDPLPRDYGMDYWLPVWVALLWAAVVLLHLLRTAGLLRRPTPPEAIPPETIPAGPPPPPAADAPAVDAPAVDAPAVDAPAPDATAVDAAAVDAAAVDAAAVDAADATAPDATDAPAADAAGAPASDALAVLTPREIEVLALVGQGHANKDIAAALFISERTARTHVSNILQKLELTSRTQAAILAVQAGLRP